MKQLSILLALALIAATLLACGGGGGNPFFDAVKAEGSSLTCAVYDGSVTRSSWTYGESLRTLLADLAAASYTRDADWTPSDVTLPIRGFSGQKYGSEFEVAFSNGRLITQEGIAYFFDFDFSDLETAYAWDEGWNESPNAIFPCARWLLIENNAWRADLMVPTPALDPPAGITATLDSWDTVAQLSVTLRNDSTETWNFGKRYHLQALLGGQWYNIPGRVGEVQFFEDIGYSLAPGESREMTYNLSYYHDLPEGTYRLVMYDLAVEFQTDVRVDP